MAEEQRSEARGEGSNSAVDPGRKDAMYRLADVFLSMFLALPVEEQAAFDIAAIDEDPDIT